MITAPISSNQITNVPIEFTCIEPECKTLNAVLTAIDEKLCEAGPDYMTLDFTDCIAESDTQLGVLQNIIDAVSCITPSSTVVGDAPITGLTFCSSDSWDCDENDACLTVTNACDPGVITVKVVLQALINRDVAQGNVIKDLCDRLTDLEATVAAQQLTIASIQSSCCA